MKPALHMDNSCMPFYAEPLIHLPFCPDNAILVEFSGSLAQCLLAAISGRHDGDLLCLRRREVNNPNSLMQSARCSVSTTTPFTPSPPMWIGSSPPEALPSPILCGLSRPLWAALRLAPGCSRGCYRAALGARAEVWGGMAAGGGAL